MADSSYKARFLKDGEPIEAGALGLFAGILPSVPWVLNGQPSTFASIVDRALNGKYRSVYDTDYQCLPTDLQVGVISLTAPRVISLPDVDTFPFQDLVIADESGACSDTLTITIRPGPGTGDSIAGTSAIVMSSPYQGLRFRRGATNLWIRL